MDSSTDHPGLKPNRYLNAVLTAIACLLALNLLAGRTELPTPSAASAQEVRPSDLPFNSGEQRNRQAAALDSIDMRLAAIEAKLERGINVKVTEMPPVRLVEDRSRDAGDRKDKPAPKVEVRGGPAAAAPAAPAPAPAQPAPAADPK
jgi:hypothetical protein